MAVTRSTADPTRLSCGRDVDTVWEHLDHPLDEHERTCLACQAARASLAPLAAATRDLSSADREDPELRGSSTVLAEVMAIARREVRRGRTLPLDRDDPDLAVSEYAIAAVVREASDEVAGVETRRCRVSPAELPAQHAADGDPVGVHGSPAAVALDVTLTVAAGLPIPALLDRWRDHVTGAVRTRVGVVVTRVDVTVEDVHDV